MRVLITGGAGFSGSNAVHLFLQRGAQVTIFDNLSGSDPIFLYSSTNKGYWLQAYALAIAKLDQSVQRLMSCLHFAASDQTFA